MTRGTQPPITLDSGDYLAGTTRLTTEGHGAYVLLLVDSARHGPPPDDDGILAAIARLPPRRWARLRPALLGLFVVYDGRWHRRADVGLPSRSPPQSAQPPAVLPDAAQPTSARAALTPRTETPGTPEEAARDRTADAQQTADAAANAAGESSPRDVHVDEKPRKMSPHESARPLGSSQRSELTGGFVRISSHERAEKESASGAVQAAMGAAAAPEVPPDPESGAPAAPAAQEPVPSAAASVAALAPGALL